MTVFGFSLRPQVLLGIAVVTFLVTRLWVISTFPLFMDEAIYLRWSQYIQHDRTNKFVSLTDGKQPLFIWLTVVADLIISEPVIAGRLVSVMVGLAGLVGLYYVARHVLGTSVAVVTIFFYVLSPFFLIYSSLALMDTLVATLSIWACYLSLKLWKKPGLVLALVLGSVMGWGLLTKSSAQFFMLLAPVVVVCFSEWSVSKVLHFSGWLSVSLVVAKVWEAPLRLSTYYSVIASKNHEFVRTITETLVDPLGGIGAHLPMVSLWLLSYLTLPVWVLAVASLFRIKLWRTTLFFWLYFLVPTSYLIIFGKQLYPRYFLFMCWPILILAASTLVDLMKWLKVRYQSPVFQWSWIGMGIFLLWPLYITGTILIAPNKAPLPAIEKWQFFEGQPSGMGRDKVVDYFEGLQEKKIVVMSDTAFGIFPQGLAIEFFEFKNMIFVGTDGITAESVQNQWHKHQPEAVYVIQTWQPLPAEVSAKEVLHIPRQGERNVDWHIYQTQNSP